GVGQGYQLAAVEGSGGLRQQRLGAVEVEQIVVHWVRMGGWSVARRAAGVPGTGARVVGLALFDPEAAAAGEGFAFPEGRAGLEGVDHVFAAAEGVASVRAGGRHEDDLRAALQGANATGDDGAGTIQALASRVGEFGSLALAHARIVF